jgi:hypothetical protein
LPTDTATPTSTSAPSSTPKPTWTRLPATQVPSAVLATGEQPSQNVAQGQASPFDIKEFKQTLYETHRGLQGSLDAIGPAVKGVRQGSCVEFNSYWDRWRNTRTYFGMLEPWLSIHNEYVSLVNGAVYVTEPIHAVCQTGGGIVSEEDDRKIVEYLDMAQNRIYQLRQQVESMQ